MMAKEAAVVNPKLTREQPCASAFSMPWVSIDPETDRGQRGLAPLLLHRMGHNLPGDERTLAQGIVDLLIDAAIDGHFRSLEEILIRIDGEAKSTQPAAKFEKTSLEIGEITAQRILDAYCEPGEGPPSH
jgi:hypothetical protein